MSRTSRRAGAPLTCAALAVLLAGCGGPGTATSAPDGGTDLYAALPPTVTTSATVAPPTPTSVAPTATPRPTASRSTSRKPPPPPPAPAHPWKPAGGDEFNGGALSGWTSYHSKGGFGTGLRRPEAVSQAGGLLRITARGDVSGGVASTHGQLYGRWEFRARTDAGRGFGSAILLWPDSEQWPEDGEIDIMEVPFEKRDLAHFVLHWGTANNVHGAAAPGDYTTWHTFAVEWLPDRITWYVDGAKRYETTDKARIPTKPMHLTIQLDQGPKANWIPPRDETTPPEVSLEVDWVRVSAA